MAAELRLAFRSLAALLVFPLCAGCGDSSGPQDTTIELLIDAVTTPTNQGVQTISGTTDPLSMVMITATADTAEG
ncbi:MAG: hypothetical protein R3309_01730 [Reinekea sp.]|nr:hypothetical protein [Reinekea sp.]